MSSLVLLGVTAPALASGQDVVVDAVDNGHIDGCYSRAEFRDALSRARDDQRLYGTAIDTIKEAQYSNVTLPGQPCGSGRVVPATPVAVSSSGAGTVWAGAALLVVIGALGAGALARRGPSR